MQHSFAVPVESTSPRLRLDVFIAQSLAQMASADPADPADVDSPSGADADADRDTAPQVALSRARVQQLIAAGMVQVDGEATRSCARLRPGQTVEVRVPEPEPLKLTPVPMALRVLHEDAHLLVLDKPAGLVVHPGAGQHGPTLVHGLLAHCQDLSGIGGVLRPGIVHRLDAGTTGVMVVAKNDHAHQALSAQFAARTVRKRYLALVHGQPRDERGNPARQGRLETPFGRHPTHRQRMTGRLPQSPNCRMAVTHWRVLGADSATSLLEVALETGRTHQIRVHMAEMGCPVVGDAMYGGGRPVPEHLAQTLGHQALHAALLAFAHPVTGVAHVFEAPVPPSWAAAAKTLIAPKAGG